MEILESIPIDNAENTDIESDDECEDEIKPGNDDTLSHYFRELVDNNVLSNNPRESDIFLCTNNTEGNERHGDTGEIPEIIPSCSR